MADSDPTSFSKDSLNSHLIPNLPPSMYYIPSFITPSEEQSLLQKIPSNRWVQLSNRRLQAHPARLTANNTLLASSPLPNWLVNPVVERLHALGVFDDAKGVNHCLVNEYEPGQGIMAHEDGPAYHPVVATVSLGGSTVLDITTKPPLDSPSCQNDDAGDETRPRTYRIFQEPRSLLLTTSIAYTSTLHGIAEVSFDEDLNAGTVANWNLLGEKPEDGSRERTTRVSLTFREVLKVAKVGGKLFGKTRG
ncbi:alkylated DNA repair protein alkB like 6 [Zymoseptoria brevis]|uniref:Alkylated DNA repair protein alkB like 6 n=1 Tax=Zymoseptoria brevis TaxID=1047168 RepID=A0A0F4G765_9PEZI|nr:alkylated DNA repair protein alkB like 6 [Zymoseptoria brevis]